MWWLGNHHHSPSYHLTQINQPESEADMKKPRHLGEPGLPDTLTR
jgi:hypothetical protein